MSENIKLVRKYLAIDENRNIVAEGNSWEEVEEIMKKKGYKRSQYDILIVVEGNENKYITGKRAIILTILELAREKQIVLSKTKIQKLVFLVQKELGKEYFKFVPYKYGPWSSELAEELDKLVNEGIVKKYEKDSSNFYELQTQAEKDKEVERKANKYISMPLEYLLALIYARYPEMTELSEIKEKVKEFQKRFNIL
ncbi:hypothetical protein GFS03_08230 [Sulfolobus sp. E5-1-F]|uniref:hypothetical protein n=1 Tax=Saccharolobus sp. E5-1-F TaxID=2663019 RepID=UPI001297E57E|nr:hypothetical protein [Sulfolobus sp. E5-1-F]QGA54558.1 hypothetical protein GFS03_08230 [Sulfolobus sp. E5-1-F]